MGDHIKSKQSQTNIKNETQKKKLCRKSERSFWVSNTFAQQIFIHILQQRRGKKRAQERQLLAFSFPLLTSPHFYLHYNCGSLRSFPLLQSSLFPSSLRRVTSPFSPTIQYSNLCVCACVCVFVCLALL